MLSNNKQSQKQASYLETHQVSNQLIFRLQ